MDTAISMGVIIGIVNGVSLLNLPALSPFVKFIIAIVLGLLFGVLGLFGLNLETGIIAGLASSGLYKVSQNIGGK